MTTTQTKARFRAAVPLFQVVDLVRTAEHYRDVLGFALGDYFGDPPVRIS